MRAVHEWLEAARDRMAGLAGIDPADLTLADDEIEILLGLARDAAHEGGDRTNAPLVCFLAGFAMGRDSGLDLARLARAASGEPA